MLTLLLLVGVLQFMLLYPRHATMDLPRWDESISMGQGEQFIHGGNLGPVSGTPVYALLYSVFVKVFGPVESIFIMQYFVKIVVSLLLFLFLSTYLRSLLLSSLFSMIWIVSEVNVTGQVLTNQVALGVFLIALACMKRYQVAALLLLCLCTLTRLEYLFPTVGYAGYLLWVIIRKRGVVRPDGGSVGQRRRDAIRHLMAGSLLAILILYVVSNTSDFNLGGRRTWWAFNQNYARYEVEAGRFNLNPYIDSNVVMQADFPGANSLKEALLINPRLFIRHVFRNLALLPIQVLATVALPASKQIPESLLFGALLGFVVTMLTLASTHDEFFGKTLTAIRNQRTIVFATSISMLSLMPILLVYPWPRHVLMMVPFLLFWSGLVCQEAISVINLPRFTQRVMVVMNLLFALAILGSAKLHVPKQPDRPVLAEITQLMKIWPKEPMRFLGVGSTWYVGYIGSNGVWPVEPLATIYGEKLEDGSGNMFALIRKYNPDVVLVNAELTNSRNFSADSLVALDPTHWIRCSLGSDNFYFRKGSVDAKFGCSYRQSER